MYYIEPEVLAAVIAAVVTIIIFIMQSRLARELRGRADESAVKVAELEKANSEHVIRLQQTFDDLAAYRNARRSALSRLWNAASIAQSAADGIIEESRSASFTTQIVRTASFLQQVSIFLGETEQARSSVHLNRDDIGCVLDVQNALVKLFLALDPDAGHDPNHQHKLDGCRMYLVEQVEAFRARVQAEWTPIN